MMNGIVGLARDCRARRSSKRSYKSQFPSMGWGVDGNDNGPIMTPIRLRCYSERSRRAFNRIREGVNDLFFIQFCQKFDFQIRMFKL